MKRILLVAGVILTAVPLSAGPQTAPAGKWTAPRTSDGHPDLQGLWTTQTYTPLQRPDRFAGREFLTDQEMVELTELVTQDGFDPLAPGVLAATDEERQSARSAERSHALQQRRLADHGAAEGAVEPKNLAHRRPARREAAAADAGRTEAGGGAAGRGRIRQPREPSSAGAVRRLDP